ncbi:hypothetical protein CMESO_128 (nucleomorph) [Chroomonas mesostigmatica CCMP1168]|uniref:Uncharacterized protein n=1 Tax=Chroomonas mesostigmatica CCMP1168 TaxID=1195612 RepID=J7G2R6_9CRYP|nr:hypothetical protein CMESO_128 [Chroomonas mesostigmatica CCMP1168]|mmetsp:Transcript_60026/g.147606  ORF Transcript_60026/g.147606 Transcript_60026/m.147606 type:complete len:110 (+) Transcript_60026:486-815(+)
MSERKNFNKYKKVDVQYQKKMYIKPQKKIFQIRFMIPYDTCCLFCKNKFFKGTKINAIKEKIKKENYIGVQIFRFYFKCMNCNKGMTMKTDPKSFFYLPEINCKKICSF